MTRLRRRQRPVKRKLQRGQQVDAVGSRMSRRTRAFYQLNDAWREAVDQELRRRKMSRTALAKAVGTDKSAITKLLRRSTAKNPGPETSTIVKSVADFLGIPLPGQIDEDAERVLPRLRLARQRNPDAYRGVIALLDAILGQEPVKKPPENS